MKMKYDSGGIHKNSKDREGSSDTAYLIALAVVGRESPSDIAEQLDRTYQNIINICKNKRSVLFCMKMINHKSSEKENERLLQQFISRPIKDKKERELQYYGD